MVSILVETEINIKFVGCKNKKKTDKKDIFNVAI